MESFLRAEFPLVFEHLTFTKINDLAYLFFWEGTDPALKPGLLTAHFDVVPADGALWTRPPFDGAIEDDFLYGRGTLDTKCTLLGILEAAELLLAEGFAPRRSWYFAFGGDEELIGNRGAGEISRYLEEQNITCEFALDEGTVVADGLIEGINRPIALLGISEKGYASIQLTVSGKGGHASSPPDTSTIGILADAIGALETKQSPPRLTDAVDRFLQSLAPHSRGLRRPAYRHPALFAPLIKKIMTGAPATAALVRTTRAATMIKGSEKDNVMPTSAEAVFNTRILPGDTVESTLEEFKKTIADPRVELALFKPETAHDPIPESPLTGEAYKKLEETVQSVFPEAVPAPFLSIVTTDSRYYRNITDCIFRLSPLKLTQEEIARIHGIDERISFDNIDRVITFYKKLITTFSS